MPTKDQIADALRQHKRVDLAAESLGLGLRRMYRFMGRYGLTLKGVLSWPSVPSSSSDGEPTRDAAKSDPEPLADPAKPERNARRLTAVDFTGPHRGEAGGSGSEPKSPEEMIDRYRRLRS